MTFAFWAGVVLGLLGIAWCLLRVGQIADEKLRQMMRDRKMRSTIADDEPEDV